MRGFPGQTWLPWAALLLVTGCLQPLKAKVSLPLLPAQMSADSVVLEIFFVRFPFDAPEPNGQLWQELDEQHFPAELRRHLARNGFRVGTVGGQIPITLSKLLELADKPAPRGDAEQAKLTEIDTEPRVLRRHLQIRSGQRSEIVASGVYDQLPLLLCERERGELSGQTYAQAQAMLAVKAFAMPDGRVRLELVPEVHHDQNRQRWVGSQGMLRLEVARPSRVFDELTISAALSPGSILVLASLPNRPGSLGHYFFTEDKGRLEQKLLLVRLSQVQHDPLFNPPETPRLEE